MKQILSILTLFCTALAFSQHVNFAQKNPGDRSTSIYFDCNGFIYPPLSIDQKELAGMNGSLMNWYSVHLKETDSLMELFHIPLNHSGAESRKGIYDLNDSLIKRKIQYLDSLASGNGLEFYIHGFRKSYIENGQDVTSVAEFAMLEKSLDSTRTRKNLVVWMYWDGMYDCCFSSDFKKNKTLFELYETANLNADKVSESFKKMLGLSRSKKINIVAHSLGTKIAVQSVLTSNNLEAQFTLCLIEPAIPGSLIQNYYEQTTELPNCKWLIVYNENDFVLKKKDNILGVFGPGAYKYGVTTLGCNKRKDAEKLQHWMNKTRPTVLFQLIDKSVLGKSHSLRYYTKNPNLTEVSQFLETI